MNLQIHPLADLFPLLQGEAFEQLCADIKANGLVVPIVKHEDQILDGRNRLRACEQTGVTPQFVEFSTLSSGSAAKKHTFICTPEAFIWSENMTRRHLTDDQRAAIAGCWREELEKEARERLSLGGKKAGRSRPQKPPMNSSEANRREHETRHRLAALAQVSEHKIQQTEKLSGFPELVAKVTTGEMKLSQAVKIAHPDPFQEIRSDPDQIMGAIMAAIATHMRNWPAGKSYTHLIALLRSYADKLEKKEAKLHEQNHLSAGTGTDRIDSSPATTLEGRDRSLLP